VAAAADFAEAEAKEKEKLLRRRSGWDEAPSREWEQRPMVERVLRE
jgi:hypothetical protein